PGCLKSFIRLHNLETHGILGNHKFKIKKDTLVDYTIDAFNRKIETDDVAREGRALDTFQNIALTTANELTPGWALKKNTKDGISDSAYEAASTYFIEQRSKTPPLRADPQKQLTGLFSRMEKKRVSGVSIARKKRGKQPSKSSRKRS
ncbi:hypothetical protein PMAYCL1PPCAC_27373, partial [Pristionchus mayeri]